MYQRAYASPNTLIPLNHPQLFKTILLEWVKINVGTISVDHAISLVKAQITCVQDHVSSLKSSQGLPTNTLNIDYKTQLAQYKNKIIHINTLEEKKQ